MTDETKYMFILSGAPGSGKSTLANRIVDEASDGELIRPINEVCEADDYWYLLGKGEYLFKPQLLPLAHKWCQDEVRKIVEKGGNVIVSNTNLTCRDRKPYFQMAKEHGYKVVFIHLDNDFGNIHNVPEDVVDRMRGKYQELDGWERGIAVGSDECSEELATILELVGVEVL